MKDLPPTWYPGLPWEPSTQVTWGIARASAWTSATVAGRSSMEVRIGRSWSAGRGARGFRRAGAEVGTLALTAEEAQELDGFPFAGRAEPVRDPGVELGRFARAEGQVVVTEAEAEVAVEHVDPLIALVGLQFVLQVPAAAADGDHQLVGLDAARPLGQRDHGHPVALDRAQVDARVAGWRGVDQFVQGDAVRPGQRKQQFQGGLAVAGLKAGQGAHRDAGLRGQVGEGGLALMAQRAQPRPDSGQRLIQLIGHAPSLPHRQIRLPQYGVHGHPGRRTRGPDQAAAGWALPRLRTTRDCPFRPGCPGGTAARTMIMSIPQVTSCGIHMKSEIIVDQ